MKRWRVDALDFRDRLRLCDKKVISENISQAYEIAPDFRYFGGGAVLIALRDSYACSTPVERRDSKQYRYRSEKVVDTKEDLEDSHDREGDRSDYEPDVDDEPDSNYEPDSDSERSEQSPVWKFW